MAQKEKKERGGNMKKLSDSEFEIMKVLWQGDKPMTSNEILMELKGKHDWKLAALMTFLARMAEKGYVSCDRSTRTNYYVALISQKEYQVQESKSFLEKLYDNSASKMIAQLCKTNNLSQKEIVELREYLNSLEGKEGK